MKMIIAYSLVLEYLRQSPDLNSIVILWQDLKRSGHKQISQNFNEIKRCCEVTQAELSLNQCKRLIMSKRKPLLSVSLLLKVDLQPHESEGYIVLPMVFFTVASFMEKLNLFYVVIHLG